MEINKRLLANMKHYYLIDMNELKMSSFFMRTSI